MSRRSEASQPSLIQVVAQQQETLGAANAVTDQSRRGFDHLLQSLSWPSLEGGSQPHAPQQPVRDYCAIPPAILDEMLAERMLAEEGGGESVAPQPPASSRPPPQADTSSAPAPAPAAQGDSHAGGSQPYVMQSLEYDSANRTMHLRPHTLSPRLEARPRAQRAAAVAPAAGALWCNLTASSSLY